MPRIIETVVYGIDELSDQAKEAARSWYRETCLDDEWYDFVYEDFETICRILGIALRTSPVKLMGGGTREKPHVFFAGFSSQGDGASFEGQYSHARGAAKGIRAHAPKDTELHRIAEFLQAAQTAQFLPTDGRNPAAGRATATSIAWRSRSSATARPASRRRTAPRTP